jgi:hypothetical protein
VLADLFTSSIVAGQTPSHFFMNLGDYEAWVGQRLAVTVTLDLGYECDEQACDGRGISGWSYAVCHDPDLLKVLGCESEPAEYSAEDTGSVNNGAGPWFQNISCAETGEYRGVTVAVIVTQNGDPVIPPVHSWRDVVITYEVLDTKIDCAGACKTEEYQALSVCDAVLGDEPVDVVAVNQDRQAERYRGFSGGTVTARCPPCSEDFAIAVTDGATAPGGYVDLPVFLNFDDDPAGGADLPICGWTYGVCSDPSVATPVAGVTEGTDTASIEPDFYLVSLPQDFQSQDPPCPNDGGVTVEAILDMDMQQGLLPQNDWLDVTIRYLIAEIDCTDGEVLTTVADPCDTVGCEPLTEGPVIARVNAEGGASFPAARRQAGTISIVCGAELYVRGDTDADEEVELADAVRILMVMFKHEGEIQIRDAADANDDGVVGLVDVAYLLSYLFLDGPAPEWPFPVRGIDLTADPLP